MYHDTESIPLCINFAWIRSEDSARRALNLR